MGEFLEWVILRNRWNGGSELSFLHQVQCVVVTCSSGGLLGWEIGQGQYHLRLVQEMRGSRQGDHIKRRIHQRVNGNGNDCGYESAFSGGWGSNIQSENLAEMVLLLT